MNLQSINGIQETSLELLEAVGFSDVQSLAGANSEVLYEELTKANESLSIADENVSHDEVAAWIVEAQAMLQQENESEASVGQGEGGLVPVNYERSPQVVGMLEAAPFALPLPARLMVENQLKVSEIPEGIMLNCYYGDLDVRVSSEAPKPSRSGVQRAGSVPASVLSNERQSIIRGPSEDTNGGRDRNSHWYIRGVLHGSPLSVYFGALVTILLMVMVPLAVASAVLLILSLESPEDFGWVPEWVLAFPIVLPLFGIAYFLWGVGCNCCVCRQKLFVHRKHLKNSKAHRIPGLGYVLPLCIQILIFRWFRCTHCGTSIRLKK